MPEPQEKENVQRVVPFTFNDMLWLQLQEIGKRFDQVDKRIDQLDKRFEQVDKRIDQLDKRMEKLEEKVEKLDDKMEAIRQEINHNIHELRKDIQTSSNHGNIMTATVIGIALAVVYSILK